MKEINIDFSTPETDYQQILWDPFANKCEEDQFSHITTEKWFDKWLYYKNRDGLLKKQIRQR